MNIKMVPPAPKAGLTHGLAKVEGRIQIGKGSLVPAYLGVRANPITVPVGQGHSGTSFHLGETLRQEADMKHAPDKVPQIGKSDYSMT